MTPQRLRPWPVVQPPTGITIEPYKPPHSGTTNRSRHLTATISPEAGPSIVKGDGDHDLRCGWGSRRPARSFAIQTATLCRATKQRPGNVARCQDADRRLVHR